MYKIDHLDIHFKIMFSQSERHLVDLTTFRGISHEPFRMERSTGVRFMTDLIISTMEKNKTKQLHLLIDVFLYFYLFNLILPFLLTRKYSLATHVTLLHRNYNSFLEFTNIFFLCY